MKETRPLGADLQLTLSDEADEKLRQEVQGRIRAFNNEISPHHRAIRGKVQTYNLFLNDKTGQLAGGLIASMYWGWLEIEDLWLAENLRRHGLGRQLLEMAEAEGRRRGCQHAVLNTFSFQARGFYEKAGYRVVGELKDYPPGASFYWMRKELGTSPAAAGGSVSPQS